MRRVFVVCSVASLLAIAACGGGGSEQKPKPSAAEGINGTYAATTTVVRSTDKKQKTGAASKDEIEYTYLCADDDCTSVYQRIGEPGGRTRLFKVAGSTWTWSSKKTTPCVAPAKGSSTVTEDWTWTRAADGTMTGTRENKTTGCNLDSSSSVALTVGARTGDLPYVAGSEAVALKKALTDYDVAMKPLYAKFPTCQKDFYADLDASIVKGGACFAQLSKDWSPILASFGSALEGQPVKAPTGACKTAVEKGSASAGSPLAKLRTAVAAVGPAMQKAATTGDYASAGKNLQSALDLQGGFQSAYIELAMQCIAPNDLAGLGEGGVLETDADKVIKPQTPDV
jgi:hypothetical protein